MGKAQSNKDFVYVCGVDPGVETGFAVRDLNANRLIMLDSMKIHQAMLEVYNLTNINGIYSVFVFVEDPRQWTGKFPHRGGLQGVGSVKRDAGVWSDFLSDHGIPHKMVKPLKADTKWSHEYFIQVTGWAGMIHQEYKGKKRSTNQHMRDAGVLALRNPDFIQQMEYARK